MIRIKRSLVYFLLTIVCVFGMAMIFAQYHMPAWMIFLIGVFAFGYGAFGSRV